MKVQHTLSAEAIRAIRRMAFQAREPILAFDAPLDRIGANSVGLTSFGDTAKLLLQVMLGCGGAVRPSLAHRSL